MISASLLLNTVIWSMVSIRVMKNECLRKWVSYYITAFFFLPCDLIRILLSNQSYLKPCSHHQQLCCQMSL